MQSSNQNWPVFIFGTQRSGTTLLARILTAHPNIHIQNELELSKVFNKQLDVDELIKKIKIQIKTEGGVDIDDALSKQIKIWGVKDPLFTKYINLLPKFLPHSKFIIIIRDSRGVTNSYKKNRWGLGTNVYSGAHRWKNEIELQLNFIKKHSKNVYVIKYEDLIYDISSSIEKLCLFLSIPFNRTMTSYHKSNASFELKPENINTIQEPSNELAQKWKEELSSYEINIIENITESLLSELGYSLIGQKIKISLLEKIYFKLQQGFFGELQLQYRWRKYSYLEFLKRIKGR